MVAIADRYTNQITTQLSIVTDEIRQVMGAQVDGKCLVFVAKTREEEENQESGV